jgi:hypothetical protein
MLQAAITRCIPSALLSIAFILLTSTSIYRPTPFRLLNSKELEKILVERKKTNFLLGRTKLGREVEAYFFPGTSDKRALIIGGVHGSELSSIEVATELLRQLSNDDSLFYNVIIIPSLLPDNAETAKQFPQLIGDVQNIGRYSYPGAVDPNRQMPTPGQPFDETEALDHAGRKVEMENALLLELIGQYRPQRIVNLHAIRNTMNAGIYADPRTDHNGIALGYASDSSLAITIAQYIQQQGGYVPGNQLGKKPNALYYKDPTPAAGGMPQKRNYSGSPMPGHRGGGVSLGTWASTAVRDEMDPSRNREAIRILTMEFPGSKRPIDHKPSVQAFYHKQVHLYATALKTIFLGNYFIER